MTRIKGVNVHLGSNFILPIDQTIIEEESKLQKAIRLCEEKKQQLIKEGRQKANELIVQAEQLLEQAKIDGEKIVADAIEKAQNESDAIHQQAHNEGFDAGHKEGFDVATHELENKFVAIENFAKCQFNLKHNIIKSAELDIINLVVAITKKVCLKSLNLNIEILKEITTSAIKMLKDKENITIMINPALAETIYSISDELQEKIPQLQSIKIIEDINISADGTIVESLLSRVDCRIKSQIDEITEKLMSEYYSKTSLPEENKELAELPELETTIIEKEEIKDV